MSDYRKLRELVRKDLTNELAPIYAHTEWVYDWCLKMGRERGANLDILLPAALVHDVGISVDRERHYEAGKEKAKEILKEAGFPAKDMEPIIHCMEAHSCYGGPAPQTLEAKVLYDSTKIDYVGPFCPIRTFLENFQKRTPVPRSLHRDSLGEDLGFNPQIHQKELFQAWEEFVSSGKAHRNFVPPHIMESWERSRSRSINPYRFSSSSYLGPGDYDRTVSENQCLIDIARPFMEIMCQSLGDTGYIVALYDVDGYQISWMGQKSVFDLLAQLGIRANLCFDEETIGTTGFSLVKDIGVPCQITGCEHYSYPMHFIIGSYAPVRELGRGYIVGAIGIYGVKTISNHQTLGMAIAASKAIENSLRLDNAQKTLFVYGRALRTAMDSMTDGVMLIDTGGRIYEINSSAKKILKLDKNDVKERHISDVIAIPVLESHILSILQLKSTEGFERNLEINNQPYITTIKFVRDEGEKIQGVFVHLKNVKSLSRILHNMSEEAKFTFDTMIGLSSEFSRIQEIAKIAAASDANVIIEGESGSGKEVFAQAIHNSSGRRNEPFIVINCSTIPSELMESTLFGHEKGAFTGANRTHIGKFELADRGTVFLDEIADMPFSMQAKLLRVLEESKIERIGGRESFRIDTRVIAATNRDISEEVKRNRFREDLFFRLNVFRIKLPPLRERKEDIYELVPYFLRCFNSYFSKKIRHISDGYYHRLMDYNWPGNIRELKNAIQYSVAVCDGDFLDENHLSGFFKQILKGKGEMDKKGGFKPSKLSAVEKLAIEKSLRHTKGNKARASRLLGIGRATLYRKMRSLGIG